MEENSKKCYWIVPENINVSDFDFNWRPDPNDEPFIHEFGTQWQKTGGPKYVVPGATVIKYRTEQFSIHLPSKENYTIAPAQFDFDFSWHPDATEPPYIYIWGNVQTPGEVSPTVMYTCPGATEKKFMHNDIRLVKDCDMFYIVTCESKIDRFDELKKRYPQLQKTRFVNNWVDTINRCGKKSRTLLFWVLSSDINYSDFTFDFYPEPWQIEMLHIFGTQWNHWGHTYLVNKDVFASTSQYIPIIEHLPNINHVTSKKIYTADCVHDILYIDHGNESFDTLPRLQYVSNNVIVRNFKTSYLDVIRNWLDENPHLKQKPNYHIWVASSLCDYSKFDFSWQCDPYQKELIHVFGSSFNGITQRFGDTFFINVSLLSEYIDSMKYLDDYPKKFNYVNISAERWPHPQIKHNLDSQTLALSECKNYPYYELIDENNCINYSTPTPLKMWDERTPITVKSTGGSHLLLPHNAVVATKTELYDYPFIIMDENLENTKSLDIIFISNGEPAADDNYNRLLELATAKSLTNRIVRINNINGRVDSQYAAANASTTNWYFLVNGKIYLNDTFDWSWQPDRLQAPKHYIFTVTNPVNGLEYGHQAIVANNKTLTLNTHPKGLDFTLDSLHTVIDMNCGVAVYNTDPWTTWRTAFRESIKLRSNSDLLSKERLIKWCNTGVGENHEWSQRGAQDGVKYWESVNGNLPDLMLSYDWAWIRDYYTKLYGNI